MSRPQNPEYASPVIRDPSPASSVGTVYGPDQTPSSDEELDQAAFERKWDYEVAGALHLHKLTAEEEAANKDPLIARPSTAAEERRACFIRRGWLRLQLQLVFWSAAK
jgi:hypothetical protein